MKVNVWLVTRKRKRGKTYAIRWIDPATGKMRCEGVGSDHHLAKRLLERKRQDLLSGRLGDPIKAGFDDFVAMVVEHREQKERAESTVREIERVLLAFKMICDPKDVMAITPAMIDRFDAVRRQGSRRCSACRWSNVADAETCWKCGKPLKLPVKPIGIRTRCKSLGYLKGALETARRTYRLPVNPMADYEFPVVEQKMPRALEVSELLALYRAADEQWKAFLYIGATAGPRSGELLKLNWGDVDFDKGLLALRGTKGRCDRVAYLDDGAVGMLRELKERRRIVGPSDVAIFLRTDGQIIGHRWTQTFVNRQWHRLREQAGVAYCTPHALRKSCGTFLAEAGVNQRIAREVTGHATAAVLEQYYQLARSGAARDAVTKAAAPLREAIAGA